MSLHQFPLDLDKGDLQPKLGIQVVVQLQSSFWSWGALSDENLQPGDVVLNLFDHRAQCFVLQLTRSLHNPRHFTCYLNSEPCQILYLCKFSVYCVCRPIYVLNFMSMLAYFNKKYLFANIK